MLQSQTSSAPIDLQAAIGRRNWEQIRAGQRFAFGRNWQRFLAGLNETRIRQAETSLRTMLGVANLQGRSFLDIGSGCGLFSLAANRLGAARVHSFDFDPESVACAIALKQRYFPDGRHWSIECGDVLSEEYLATLPCSDVVYCWGVLHQTGQMWDALENTLALVAPGGCLFASIYNHQPLGTPCWTAIKRLYNLLPPGTRWPLVLGYLAIKTPLMFARDIVTGRDPRSRMSARRERGMSMFHDAADWIGGYPYQTAKPETIFRFVHARGFHLRNLRTVGGGSGCNEFIFERAH